MLSYCSPIGTLQIEASQKGICSIQIVTSAVAGVREPQLQKNKLLSDCHVQLSEYFSGDRSSFDLPMDPQGTPFQKAVWKAIFRIPYGKTASYADIARMVGKPQSARAVGNALNRNPLLILAPCHRIVPKSGEIGGFAGGVKAKEWLLDKEKE